MGGKGANQAVAMARLGAQLLFTTNSIDILERELIGKDQYYFVDKNSRTGITELYSLCDFPEYEDEKIGRAYLIGKYGSVPYIQSMRETHTVTFLWNLLAFGLCLKNMRNFVSWGKFI